MLSIVRLATAYYEENARGLAVAARITVNAEDSQCRSVLEMKRPEALQRASLVADILFSTAPDIELLIPINIAANPLNKTWPGQARERQPRLAG